MAEEASSREPEAGLRAGEGGEGGADGVVGRVALPNGVIARGSDAAQLAGLVQRLTRC